MSTIAVERQDAIREHYDWEDLKDGEEVTDVGRFLIESGILFKLNRCFWYCIGWSMTLVPVDRDDPSQGLRISIRRYKNPVMIHTEAVFKAGMKKWKRFNSEFAIPAAHIRKEKMGFIVQCNPDSKIDRTENKI